MKNKPSVVGKEVKMVKIPGNTPTEIANNYARISNELMTATETRYSTFHNEMMPWAVHGTFFRTIGNEYFVEVEEGFYNNPPSTEDDE